MPPKQHEFIKKITKLDGTNFPTWILTCRAVLRKAGLFDVVTGVVGCPRQPDPPGLMDVDAANAANSSAVEAENQRRLAEYRTAQADYQTQYVQWATKQQSAFDEILLMCDEKVFVHLEGLDSGSAAWSKL